MTRKQLHREAFDLWNRLMLLSSQANGRYFAAPEIHNVALAEHARRLGLLAVRAGKRSQRRHLAYQHQEKADLDLWYKHSSETLPFKTS